MWKLEHRRAADRNHLRYPSDLTDAEWAPVEPLLPPGRHGGRKRSVNVREVLNGIFYVLFITPTSLPVGVRAFLSDVKPDTERGCYPLAALLGRNGRG
jgi:hypothetical protein